MLDAKPEEAGRLVLRVNPANTSRDCSSCGNRKTDLALFDRTYVCEHCGVVLDRDINAARNILARARATTGAGTAPVHVASAA
jgi:putative transposase